MRYRDGDRVTVIADTTVELPDCTVRLSAGLVLTVLGVREGAVRVLDVDSAATVWVPDKLVRRA